MHNQPEANYRVSVKALITVQGKLLLVKEGGDPWWGLPGGGMDHGESIEEALRRELREEVGSEVASYDMRPAFVWAFHYTSDHPVGTELPGYKAWIVYHVNLAGPPKPPKDKLKLVAPEELKKEDLAPYFHDQAFLELQKFFQPAPPT